MDQEDLPGEEDFAAPGDLEVQVEEIELAANHPDHGDDDFVAQAPAYWADLAPREEPRAEDLLVILQYHFDWLLSSDDPEERASGVGLLLQLLGNTDVAELVIINPYNRNQCSVCLENYSPTDNITVFTCHTTHHFHKECIEKWLLQKPDCPLCRSSIRLNLASLRRAL
ncbi:hypothetical protein MJO29_016021 [Puccinia striiformis f. sp. tritici]|nr:hypothetical protein Pst134EB_030839 [Puccinia striiformis f. sp. tritici]KAI7934758.1 hypothetical protein MJO29_016021 [Puccinia striiformis f. sp. tritici]KAI9601900.1 hypothetical protein KEM48_001188 [Puccinia striiformis f. sp. tritici PST-130]